MKDTLKDIKIAFILNLLFSIAEMIGGIVTNSISIISDSIHDLGDAISIAIALFMEKISIKNPDSKYTYGYKRYSILGALITATILLIGSIMVIYNAVPRIINPEQVNYDGMLIFAVVGIIVNLIATLKTSKSESVNEKMVNLHMLEDVLGWAVVLVGSVLIKVFKWYIIDPILSIFIAIFILVHVIRNYRNILNLFLEKAPDDINVEELKEHILEIEHVKDIHHIHIWSLDNINNYITVHVLLDDKVKIEDIESIKSKIKEEFSEFKIEHSTIEIELKECGEKKCKVKNKHVHEGHHH